VPVEEEEEAQQQRNGEEKKRANVSASPAPPPGPILFSLFAPLTLFSSRLNINNNIK